MVRFHRLRRSARVLAASGPPYQNGDNPYNEGSGIAVAPGHLPSGTSLIGVGLKVSIRGQRS
jgi:hypothetical protein